jgi:hypothetical protein
MNEFFNPKVGLRALFSDPHWLAPYLGCHVIGVRIDFYQKCKILESRRFQGLTNGYEGLFLSIHQYRVLLSGYLFVLFLFRIES